jgi:uncharacterized repeat protein (TIGR01451 family)
MKLWNYGSRFGCAVAMLSVSMATLPAFGLTADLKLEVAPLLDAKQNPTTYAPGQTVKYRLTITNPGPNHAEDVAVTATLPAGTTLAGAVGAGCGEDAHGNPVFPCVVGDILDNASANVTVSIAYDLPGCQKSDFCNPGVETPAAYTKVCSHFLCKAVCSDSKPCATGFRCVSGACEKECTTGAECDAGQTCYANNLCGMTCPTALNPISFSVIFGEHDKTTHVITTTDPNAANNAVEVPIVLAPFADLAADLSGPKTASVGDRLTFGVTITNFGPCASASVKVDAGGVENAGTTAAGLVYNGATGVCVSVTDEDAMSCDLGAMAAGASVSYEKTYTVGEMLDDMSSTGLNNGVQVSSNYGYGTFDPDSLNDIAATLTVVKQSVGGCNALGVGGPFALLAVVGLLASRRRRS